MEINRDAMMRVVKAARAAMRMAENMRPLMVDQKGSTWADEIYGFLADALFIMSGEVLKAGQSFDDSNTIRILQSDMDDRACADWFIMMDKIRQLVSKPENDEQKRIYDPNDIVRQPAPQIMEAGEFEKVRDQNGGYIGSSFGKKM